MRGVRFFGDGTRTSSRHHAEPPASDPVHRQHPREPGHRTSRSSSDTVRRNRRDRKDRGEGLLRDLAASIDAAGLQRRAHFRPRRLARSRVHAASAGPARREPCCGWPRASRPPTRSTSIRSGSFSVGPTARSRQVLRTGLAHGRFLERRSIDATRPLDSAPVPRPWPHSPHPARMRSIVFSDPVGCRASGSTSWEEDSNGQSQTRSVRCARGDYGDGYIVPVRSCRRRRRAGGRTATHRRRVAEGEDR